MKTEQPDEPGADPEKVEELPPKPVDSGVFLEEAEEGEGGESEVCTDDPDYHDRIHDSHADQPDPEERMDPHDVT